MSRLDKIVERIQAKNTKTYAGGDVAGTLDKLRENGEAVTKGIRFTLIRTLRRGKYDHFDFFVGLKKKWSTEASYPPTQAGGTVNAFIERAFEENGFLRAWE